MYNMCSVCMYICRDDEALRGSVCTLLQVMSQLPPHHSIQLSVMLVESLTDSAFPALSQSPLVSTLFDLLLQSASSQAIISMAINKLLSEWVFARLQSHQACEVSGLWLSCIRILIIKVNVARLGSLTLYHWKALNELN